MLADNLISSEFNEEQRTVFCVFSGDGVNKLREYLNQAPEIFEGEVTMLEDDIGEDGDTDQILGLMESTGIDTEDNDEFDVEMQ